MFLLLITIIKNYLKQNAELFNPEELIIIYQDLLPPSSKGSHIKSQYTCIAQSYNIHLLVNKVGTSTLISVVEPILQFTPTASGT